MLAARKAQSICVPTACSNQSSLNISEVPSENHPRPPSHAVRRALAVHAVMPARYRRALQLHVGEDGVMRKITLYRDDSTTQVVFENVKHWFWTASNTVLTIAQYTDV